MVFPIKVCVVCGEEFELRPGKPGFANRCPSCSEPESSDCESASSADPVERRIESEVNALRRRAIRDMLYRKDS
jgi:predicted amidophosphoribosyltransferase